jgi:hypothetical protein
MFEERAGASDEFVLFRSVSCLLMRWHFPASDCFFAPLSLRQRKWKEELMVPIARTKHRALILG